jgi:hypothetical protein
VAGDKIEAAKVVKSTSISIGQEQYSPNSHRDRASSESAY